MTLNTRRRTTLVTIDLKQTTGTPISTTQLADAVGLSDETIRRDIALGEIAAGAKRGPNGRRRYLIPWPEARRYAVQLGVIHDES